MLSFSKYTSMHYTCAMLSFSEYTSMHYTCAMLSFSNYKSMHLQYSAPQNIHQCIILCNAQFLKIYGINMHGKKVWISRANMMKHWCDNISINWIKACLDGMILSAWQNHTWFCHVWFLCLDGITMSCVISFNSGETGWAPWAISSCSTSFHCYS